MSNSSVPPDYSITSIDTLTIDTSMAHTSAWSIPSTGTISITGGGVGTAYTMANGGFTIGAAGSSYSNVWSTGKEFVDCMPNFSRIEAMCKEYPGLAIAFEKFKTTYYLVKDDYDNPKDKK